MKYWFKNVADNIYIYPKSAPRNLILQTRTSDCNSASQIDWLTERFPDGVYTDVVGLCKAAPMSGEDGIIDQDYSLNAGRYVGVVIEDDGLTPEEFKEEIYSLNNEFTALSIEAKRLEELIANNLKGLLGE